MAKFAVILMGVVLLMCVSFTTTEARSKISPNDKDKALNSSCKNICNSMVAKRGYPCQEHTVITNDGYILTLQRIPASASSTGKPPVLLQHGLIADAAMWVMPPSKVSLPFLLADQGYDVWLANSRGSFSSLSHVSIPYSNPAYWEWTWDDLVAYDLPTVLGYVHNTTGQKFHYVGHSLGTLIALGSLSSQQEFSKYVRSAALLSPIAYVNQITSNIARTAADDNLAEELYNLGLHRFLPSGNKMLSIAHRICQLPGIDCSDITSVVTGPNCCLEKSVLHTFVEYGMQQTSMKNMRHLTQMFKTGIIKKFDYKNVLENVNHYKQLTPPVYNLENIPKDFPLFLAHGGKDTLSDINDVGVLLNRLRRNHEQDKLVVVFQEDYGHIDFVLASNADKTVYYPLMEFISRH